MFGFKIQSVESLKEKFKGEEEKGWTKIKENKGGKMEDGKVEGSSS